MKPRRLSLPAALALTCSILGASYEPPPVVVGKPIPDGNFSGLSSTLELSGLSYLQITRVEIDLTIGGGFNGDLYAYLWHQAPDHSTAFSVLLNRSGRTGAYPLDSFGYADSGFNVTFADGAPDIHTYGGNGGAPLTGRWEPDARTDSPLTVTDDPASRFAFLNAFMGMNPDGLWTLAVYDLGSGDKATFEQWGLRLELVPEPGHAATVVALGLALAWIFHRWNDESEIRALAKPRHARRKPGSRRVG